MRTLPGLAMTLRISDLRTSYSFCSCINTRVKRSENARKPLYGAEANPNLEWADANSSHPWQSWNAET